MNHSFLKLLPTLALPILFSLAALASPTAQAGELLSQPMPGATTHRETTILFEAKNSHHAILSYSPSDAPQQTQKIKLLAPAPHPLGGQIYRFTLQLLRPGTRYNYEITLDGKKLNFPQPLQFQTLADWQFRATAPDFSFITGSCNYLNDQPYDRPGKPYGQGDHILDHMARSGADFMLWLGDSLYLRPADYSSASGIWYRYQREFSAPEFQALRSAMHHYAIWDDHEYGPNDSDKTYRLKETALQVFQSYWANPSYGEPDNPGVYTSFTWSDCAFFLLDNRYHRDANDLDPKTHPNKTQFGPRQIDWLKQSLLNHKNARFKFIVMGGQFLHDHKFESFSKFPAERQHILDFLKTHQINGVVFISGDRHFTELTKMPAPAATPSTT
ncbi:MAG: alkaline phosphatase family protein [Blastochloris sp.]|nr:alkaline phosphatase family protein [Blastochloris sp.]